MCCRGCVTFFSSLIFLSRNQPCRKKANVGKCHKMQQQQNLRGFFRKLNIFWRVSHLRTKRVYFFRYYSIIEHCVHYVPSTHYSVCVCEREKMDFFRFVIYSAWLWLFSWRIKYKRKEFEFVSHYPCGIHCFYFAHQVHKPCAEVCFACIIYIFIVHWVHYVLLAPGHLAIYV